MTDHDKTISEAKKILLDLKRDDANSQATISVQALERSKQLAHLIDSIMIVPSTFEKHQPSEGDIRNFITILKESAEIGESWARAALLNRRGDSGVEDSLHAIRMAPCCIAEILSSVKPIDLNLLHAALLECGRHYPLGGAGRRCGDPKAQQHIIDMLLRMKKANVSLVKGGYESNESVISAFINEFLGTNHDDEGSLAAFKLVFTAKNHSAFSFAGTELIRQIDYQEEDKTLMLTNKGLALKYDGHCFKLSDFQNDVGIGRFAVSTYGGAEAYWLEISMWSIRNVRNIQGQIEIDFVAKDLFLNFIRAVKLPEPRDGSVITLRLVFDKGEPNPTQLAEIIKARRAHFVSTLPRVSQGRGIVMSSDGGLIAPSAIFRPLAPQQEPSLDLAVDTRSPEVTFSQEPCGRSLIKKAVPLPALRVPRDQPVPVKGKKITKLKPLPSKNDQDPDSEDDRASKKMKKLRNEDTPNKVKSNNSEEPKIPGNMTENSTKPLGCASSRPSLEGLTMLKVFELSEFCKFHFPTLHIDLFRGTKKPKKADIIAAINKAAESSVSAKSSFSIHPPVKSPLVDEVPSPLPVTSQNLCGEKDEPGVTSSTPDALVVDPKVPGVQNAKRQQDLGQAESLVVLAKAVAPDVVEESNILKHLDETGALDFKSPGKRHNQGRRIEKRSGSKTRPIIPTKLHKSDDDDDTEDAFFEAKTLKPTIKGDSMKKATPVTGGLEDIFGKPVPKETPVRPTKKHNRVIVDSDSKQVSTISNAEPKRKSKPSLIMNNEVKNKVQATDEIDEFDFLERKPGQGNGLIVNTRPNGTRTPKVPPIETVKTPSTTTMLKPISTESTMTKTTLLAEHANGIDRDLRGDSRVKTYSNKSSTSIQTPVTPPNQTQVVAPSRAQVRSTVLDVRSKKPELVTTLVDSIPFATKLKERKRVMPFREIGECSDSFGNAKRKLLRSFGDGDDSIDLDENELDENDAFELEANDIREEVLLECDRSIRAIRRVIQKVNLRRVKCSKQLDRKVRTLLVQASEEVASIKDLRDTLAHEEKQYRLLERQVHDRSAQVKAALVNRNQVIDKIRVDVDMAAKQIATLKKEAAERCTSLATALRESGARQISEINKLVQRQRKDANEWRNIRVGGVA